MTTSAVASITTEPRNQMTVKKNDAFKTSLTHARHAVKGEATPQFNDNQNEKG
jgi:hypothetical protein